MMAFITGRFGLAAVALLMALTWHYTDKIAAVRSAEGALADRVEIAALTAERDAALRLAATTEAANKRLTLAVSAASEGEEKAKLELERYALSTEINPDCVVDDNFLEWLRSQ